jgi:transcriptional regulator with XRE-family HTH domain
MTTMGERARIARKAAGLSQPRLGKLIGCSASALSQLETDTTAQPRSYILLGYEMHTGYSARWIATGKGPQMTSDDAVQDLYRALMELPDRVRQKLLADVQFFADFDAGRDGPE